MSEIHTCVGGWPLKLHVYVISSPSTMVAGLMLRDAAHGEGGGGEGGSGVGGGVGGGGTGDVSRQ